jgi:hypothetical protein
MDWYLVIEFSSIIQQDRFGSGPFDLVLEGWQVPALLVKIGDGPVQRFNIDREAVVIGRAETVDVRIKDAAVSRVHCQVSRTPAGRWILQDFGSRNHTYLDDHPITKHELIHGDTFYVGPAKIVFSGAPAEGTNIPGGTTLPLEDKDELLMAEVDSRFGGLAEESSQRVSVSEDLAELAVEDSGDMTMVPDDPLQALADDASRIDSGTCPLCDVPILPGRTYCDPCAAKLDEQRQAMILKPEERSSFWRKLFGR